MLITIAVFSPINVVIIGISSCVVVLCLKLITFGSFLFVTMLPKESLPDRVGKKESLKKQKRQDANQVGRAKRWVSKSIGQKARVVVVVGLVELVRVIKGELQQLAVLAHGLLGNK